MKTVVLYDSQYGNTKQIAEAIASTLSGKVLRVDEFRKHMLNDVDLLIVGCPVQGWRPTTSTLRFLASLPSHSLQNVAVAAFDTRIKSIFSGDAANKIYEKLVHVGGTAILPPGNFVVTGTKGPLADGEIERAKHWAAHIIDILSHTGGDTAYGKTYPQRNI